MSLKGNQASEKLYVIYDGHCNLCLASVARLRELHSKADLQFIQIQQLEAVKDTARLIPHIDRFDFGALYEKMHVADERGQLFAGADGVVRILRTVRGFRWLSAFYRIPGMNRIADRIYRFIANRRYEWFGSTEQSCSIDGCDLPQDRGERNKLGN
ncbi:thiol-disulfide oxidoreductase DCC family protein [Paenibacillus sp. LPE1-1-1.1]|uniref:thiol-disulfide oxidoreductase DCC family protein n=1 Tax=Paenibacillus sp. LPE1-1-1.1 TaxID=3135230 RepID=UPI0034337C24